MRKLYRPFHPREAAARGMLEVSLCRWLRKTLGAAAKASFHNHNFYIPLTHPFNDNRLYLRPSMFVDLQ